ncbi:MAG: tetratricopeptide repeat protein [Stigonema ocellatum SAG 48.90 = DSM 106950]|nr:tetratricopeptide repeat protein [Stigonema ocellatum SAG 48.90 = DSM 106950]
MTNHKEVLLGGRYRILRELARGSFGVTYLAEDTHSSNLLCVIKKLDPLIADIETAKNLFIREVHILYFLQQNQQIPKYFNYFEEQQNYYLVQEYIRGKSLDKLLDKQWTQIKIIDFLQEILLILKNLHQINIIHRDIKPSNVMLREEDEKFVLIDFGAVKQLDPKYLSSPHPQHLPLHTIIGTPGYAPAEQMAGRPGFNSDIYGLGITAIQLLTGIHPQNLNRDQQDNIIFPKEVNINNSLAALLKKMVYTSTERRYQSVDKVLESLNEVINQRTIKQGRVESQNQNTQAPLRISLRLWHIPIVLTALGAILVIIELIHPFVRPLYYLYQGNHLLDIRQPEKALKEFENLIEIDPKSAEAWKGRGNALFSKGRELGALESYNRVLFLQPNDIKTLNNKGKTLWKLRKYKEALETHEKALELNPDSPEAWSGKGLAHLGLKQFQQVTECFEKLKQISRPDQPGMWYQIGMATEQLQGPQAAKTYYEEALSVYDNFINRQSKDPIAWTDRGNVLLKLGRQQDALASYEKALQVDNNFYEALVGKGNALNNLGKRQEALLAFNQASKIRPEDYQIWINRGTLLAKDFQDYEEALKSFDKATKLRDDLDGAWLNKGIALSELKRYDEALVAFDKAKDLNPKDPYIWASRGDALEQLGKNKEACYSYKKAIELGMPSQELETAKVCGINTGVGSRE